MVLPSFFISPVQKSRTRIRKIKARVPKTRSRMEMMSFGWLVLFLRTVFVGSGSVVLFCLRARTAIVAVAVLSLIAGFSATVLAVAPLVCVVFSAVAVVVSVKALAMVVSAAVLP